MATAQQMLDRFKTVTSFSEIRRIAALAIEQSESQYLNLVRDQLQHGLDADGNPLPKYKSDKYARAKQLINSLPGFGTPDYKLTGATYNEMYIDFINQNVVVLSNTPYFGDLTARGGNPFGLNKKSKEDYIKQYFKSIFIQTLADATGVTTI